LLTLTVLGVLLIGVAALIVGAVVVVGAVERRHRDAERDVGLE
jgi:hypothetical protein